MPEEKTSSIEEIIRTYDGDNLMNLLNQIQEKEGRLSKETLLRVSKELNIPLAQLYSTASFYSFFEFESKGKRTIQVCDCLSCRLNGSEGVLKAIEKLTGLGPGQGNEKFSVEVVQCMGCCDKAPAMLLDGEFHVKLTEEKLTEIIK